MVILLVNTYFILLIILKKLNSTKKQQSNLLINGTLNLRTLKFSYNLSPPPPPPLHLGCYISFPISSLQQEVIIVVQQTTLWHLIKCTKCTFCSSSTTFHNTSMNLTPKFKIWSPTTHINRIVKLKASLSNPSSKYPSLINVVQVTTFFFGILSNTLRALVNVYSPHVLHAGKPQKEINKP